MTTTDSQAAGTILRFDAQHLVRIRDTRQLSDDPSLCPALELQEFIACRYPNPRNRADRTPNDRPHHDGNGAPLSAARSNTGFRI